MKNSVSVSKLLKAIRALPSDSPINNPDVWYLTQKEHWIGWLREYHDAGAYGRKTGVVRDAKFAYNHVVNPKMLLWLVDASGVDRQLVDASLKAYASGTSLMQKAGAIRRVAPWETVAEALWPSE